MTRRIPKPSQIKPYLYLMRDREITLGHLAQARDAGDEALMFTVDTPVAGHRRRDFHNGFDIPPNLTPRALLDMAVNPRGLMKSPTRATVSMPARLP